MDKNTGYSMRPKDQSRSRNKKGRA